MVDKASRSPSVGPETEVATTHVDEDNEIKCKVAASDLESQSNVSGNLPPAVNEKSLFKSLSWLDRYLAVWILLAIIIGILLGNFAPDAAAALDRGRFVGVSVPIGRLCFLVLSPLLFVPLALVCLYFSSTYKRRI